MNTICLSCTTSITREHYSRTCTLLPSLQINTNLRALTRIILLHWIILTNCYYQILRLLTFTRFIVRFSRVIFRACALLSQPEIFARRIRETRFRKDSSLWYIFVANRISRRRKNNFGRDFNLCSLWNYGLILNGVKALSIRWR